MANPHNPSGRPVSNGNGSLLKAVRYEQTIPPSPPTSADNGIKRPRTSPSSPSSGFKFRSPFTRNNKKDSPSPLGTPQSLGSGDGAALEPPPGIPKITFDGSTASLPFPIELPAGEVPTIRSVAQEEPLTSTAARDPPTRISTDIPSGDLFGLDSMDQMSFSNRGSVLFRGKKANDARIGLSRANSRGRPLDGSTDAPLNGRVLSTDEEMLSQKVRSLYDVGSVTASSDMNGTTIEPLDGQRPRNHVITEEMEPTSAFERPSSKGTGTLGASTPLSTSHSATSIRETHERAGGIEDWEDVDGRDVDRYGFIVPRKHSTPPSSAASGTRPKTPEPQVPQRMSTLLQIASETPRRKRSLRRKPSNRTKTPPKSKPDERSPRGPSSIYSDSSTKTRSPQRPLRNAANRLPGNRNRRAVDEAGDMLTLPPGLADIAEEEDGGKAATQLKRKEWERTEKWNKMARVVSKSKDGKGTKFDFDVGDPKLVSRTWKGIPDRWRATAWHAFLTASAKKRGGFLQDDALIDKFYEFLGQNSADDVQIDINVPRTINQHIMFRKRYRGGQRLLFRVLHSMSLYFPDTGYVQGMASLTATLLCYYDEETAFVMLVRLWQLRGLDKLYQSGFGGLMAALGEFEKKWLADGEVAKKLTNLGIDPTAYGTRWYLTLFNYSIPFPAQLRVWDVFMLLGDPSSAPSPPFPRSSAEADSAPSPVSFNGTIDVLHATSAALIDGLREIILDSDFENGMKVLTSWIPVKDEDLLMRVARAEWKMRRGGRSRGKAG